MFHIHHLPNQTADEKTVLFLRRHWIVLLKLTVITVAVALLPVVVLTLFEFLAPTLIASDGAVAIKTIFLATFYLALITFTCQEFIDYYLDTWIVTTERVVNIEQSGLFNRTASELHLGSIQDISAVTKGLLQTFLNYGDVIIQTAGSVTHFRFEMVPRPEKTRELILRLVELSKKRHPQQPHT